MIKSIGAIEFKSIAKGIEVSNDMVKKFYVEVLYLKSICPGKFLIIIAGETSYVNESINYGLTKGKGYIVDSFIINSISEDIINGIKHKYKTLENIRSIGILETNKVCSGIKALDKTLKYSDVNLVKLQLSFAIGGKLVYIVEGDASSLEHGIEEGKSILNSKDIISDSIIQSVDNQIIKNLI
ncbi:MAG: BMC domain-containing protein [Terrisporobacter sp.]|uniref:BMC domain-containing protein n=1 Tax=Terrisporobacter sp. TaxID=1965305 RepID=UPI002FC6348C